jgi:hypothetical protein
MRGVSLPTHLYTALAENCLAAPRESAVAHRQMRQSTRAYTRVVLRLRAQADAMVRERALLVSASNHALGFGFGAEGTLVQSPVAQSPSQGGPPTAWSPQQGHGAARRHFSRSSSRAPSPTDTEAHSQSQHEFPSSPPNARARAHSHSRSRPSLSAAASHSGSQSRGLGLFRSPLFRTGRAPVLRVFVPSAEGGWLSDADVLRCEDELRRAGAARALRAGDVVWDVAVGEEANGNVGRLVWDGAFLIVRVFFQSDAKRRS